MDWKSDYDRKRVSPAEAMKCVKSGDRVVFAHACGEPLELVDALVARWGFDPRRAVVIGDNASDMALARAVGALAVLVRTGVGEEALGEGVDCDHVADDLVGAVAWVEGQVA